MARRRGRFRFRSRRGTVRAPARRRKWTLLRGMKVAIGVGPVAGITLSQVIAQPNATGVQTALGTLTSAYTGYDVRTNSFQPQNLILGYLPLGGAYVFGKVASRVLR